MKLAIIPARGSFLAAKTSPMMPFHGANDWRSGGEKTTPSLYFRCADDFFTGPFFHGLSELKAPLGLILENYFKTA